MKPKTIELIKGCISNIEKAGLTKEAEAMQLLLNYSLEMLQIAKEQNQVGVLQSIFHSKRG